MRRAWAKLPLASSVRTRELDTRSSSSTKVRVCSTAKPRASPTSRSSAKSPTRSQPKRKSSPTTRWRTSNPSIKHPVDELARGQAAQRLVEWQADHPLGAIFGEQLDLVAQPGEPRRRLVAGEVLARLRLEDHHRHRPPQRSGTIAQLVEDRLVPAVHAIEVADGRHATPVLRHQVVQAANQFHRSFRIGSSEIALHVREKPFTHHKAFDYNEGG